MKTLYIQTAYLGDLLLSVPTLKALRQWKPKNELVLVCRSGFGKFMEQIGVCDQVLEVDKKNAESLSRLKKELQSLEVSHLFCPHQSMRSHKLTSLVKAKDKIGYKKWWNFSFFNHRVKRPLTWPEALRQLALLAAVDEGFHERLQTYQDRQDHQIPSWSSMKVTPTWGQQDIDHIGQRLNVDLKQKFICLAPGSVWATKRWNGFLELAKKIGRQGISMALIGAPDEKAITDSIANEVPHCFSLAGQLSLWESLLVLSASQGLVCNDSGAMHMASLLNLPTVSIFGPTVLELGYQPWNPKAEILQAELSCRPCGQHGGRNCPIGTHACMKLVGADQVFESIKSWL